MIPCWRNPKTDVWEPIRNNPTITRLDGAVRAPLATICSPTWTWKERWAFGVYNLRYASPPLGYHVVATNYIFDESTNEVVESHEIERTLPVEIRTDRIPGKGNAGRIPGKFQAPGR